MNTISNNPFEAHNVNHLSASSINEYIQNPTRWLLKVSGYKENLGIPAFWRGTATDNTIEKSLDDMRLSERSLVDYALGVYDEKEKEARQGDLYFDRTKAKAERDMLIEYVKISVPFYRQLGKPIGTQGKIKLEFEEIPVPIIGYYDLYYEGVVRDIKTTNRMPSKLPNSYSRQLSIYATALEAVPLIDYVYASKTKQMVKTVPVSDIEEHMRVVRRACNSMMELLSYSDDINQIARLLVPDFDDWKWSNKEKEAAIELFNLR
jgi:hypothetical protein